MLVPHVFRGGNTKPSGIVTDLSVAIFVKSRERAYQLRFASRRGTS